MPSLVAPSSRLAPDGFGPRGRILGPVSAPGPPGGSWRAKKITFFIKIGQINRNRGLQPTRLWVKLGSMSGTPTTTTTTKGTKMTTDKTCKGSPVTARYLHELLTKIATENLATVETLKTRDEGSDGSDTHQCHVLSLKAALRSAFEAGQKNA